MSGFEFHIVCKSCALTSAEYPFLYDSVVAPSSLELPSLDRAHHAFDRVSVPIARRLDETEIAAIAADHTTAEVTICVPGFGATGVELRPPGCSCPRCGVAALECPFGAPPTPVHPAATVSELIAVTAALAIGHTVEVALTTPPARVICGRAEDGTTYSWNIARAGTADHIDAVASELRDQLIAAGNACTEPRRMRAFAEFDEVRG